MRRVIVAAVAISALFATANGASARPTQSARTCTDSQTMKIPLKELNKCALNGGAMKCTSGGYECCYDGGTYCEWQPYSARAGVVNVLPPPGGNALPPRSGRPDIRPPAGPYSPPSSTPPSRPPGFDAGRGPMVVAQPPRSSGPRIK